VCPKCSTDFGDSWYGEFQMSRDYYFGSIVTSYPLILLEAEIELYQTV